jgi:hypothetical protein
LDARKDAGPDAAPAHNAADAGSDGGTAADGGTTADKGTIVLQRLHSGATVVLDDRELSPDEAAKDIVTSPGTHRIVVRAPCGSTERTVNVAPGQRVEVGGLDACEMRLGGVAPPDPYPVHSGCCGTTKIQYARGQGPGSAIFASMLGVAMLAARRRKRRP